MKQSEHSALHPCAPVPFSQIARVHYPGLKSHPDHAVAARQMTGFGGVVSFEVQGDLWSAAKLVDSLRLPYMAPSLGGVECLVEQPAIIRCGGAVEEPSRVRRRACCAQPSVHLPVSRLLLKAAACNLA